MARPLSWTAVALVALLWAPRPAAAQQLQLHTTPAAFQQAGGTNLACVDFEDLAHTDQAATFQYGNLTLSTDSTQTYALAALGPELLPPPLSMLVIGNDVLDPAGVPPPLYLDFAQPVTAVSLDVLTLYQDLSISPLGETLVVSVEGTDGVQSVSVALTPDGPTFVGITATGGTISRITVANAPDQFGFVAVDNICHGQLALPSDTVEEQLEELTDTVAAARQSGEIKKLGRSLEEKIANAQAAYAAGDIPGTREALKSLGNQVRAQRGKHITTAAADLLLQQIQETLAALP